MADPEKIPYLSVDEYLEAESRATIRHEYVRGQMYAMTGATAAHNIISGNVHAALHGFLRGSACFVYTHDMKVRIEVADAFYYPDLLVTCEEFESQALFMRSPRLIVEVLSPSTRHIDLREKRVAYQQIESLCQYAIIHQDRVLIELHEKTPGGVWQLTKLRKTDVLHLNAQPQKCLSIPVDSVYEGVDLPPFVAESEEEYGVLEQPRC